MASEVSSGGMESMGSVGGSSYSFPSDSAITSDSSSQFGEGSGPNIDANYGGSGIKGEGDMGVGGDGSGMGVGGEGGGYRPSGKMPSSAVYCWVKLQFLGPHPGPRPGPPGPPGRPMHGGDMDAEGSEGGVGGRPGSQVFRFLCNTKYSIPRPSSWKFRATNAWRRRKRG